MSDFSFKCICCNTEIDIKGDQAGFVVYCPNCAAELIVPEFSDDTPNPQSAEVHAEPRDIHQTDSVVLKDSFHGHDDDDEHEPVDDAPAPPTPVGGGRSRSSASISQEIYRDASGKPIIPDEVARAVADGSMGDMTDTKLALAETLKALQEHQRALAEARKELAERKALQSDTDMMEISDTTNKLIQDNSDEPTTEMPLADSSFVLQPKDANIQQEEPIEEEYVEPEPPADSLHPDDMDYHPFYTPHGDFLPFTSEDFTEALQYESEDILDAVAQIRPGPHCWSYSVFALLLENHIAVRLPEHLPITPMSGVFFGSSQKYVDELRTQHTIFMNVMRRMVKPMGVQFQFAIKQHDVYAFAEILTELDRHLQELYQFMMNFQKIAFPKKDPFIRFRELMLQSYDYVRHRLVRVVERLDQRSERTPEEAMYGTINVSLNPPQLHEMAILLELFPVQ